jgi:phenylalanyl-tRNA synthetase beta chain
VSTDSYEASGAELKDAVKIVNPLSETQSVLRASLLPSLIENLKRNISQKQDELSIFEVAPVFSSASGETRESWWASGLIYGTTSLHEQGWNTADAPVDIYDAKGAVESTLLALGIDTQKLEVVVANGPLFHPTRAGKFLIDGKTLATFAEINPQLSSEIGLKESAYLFEIDISQVADIYSNIKSFEPLNRFPESTRDIAFVVDEEVTYLKIYNSIKALDRKVVEKVELFDVYYDKDFQKGKRSLGLRITYRAKDKTLTSDEIDSVHTNVIDELKGKFSAEIRV